MFAYVGSIQNLKDLKNAHEKQCPLGNSQGLPGDPFFHRMSVPTLKVAIGIFNRIWVVVSRRLNEATLEFRKSKIASTWETVRARRVHFFDSASHYQLFKVAVGL